MAIEIAGHSCLFNASGLPPLLKWAQVPQTSLLPELFVACTVLKCLSTLFL